VVDKPLIFVRAKNVIAIFSKDFFMSERQVAGDLGSTVLHSSIAPNKLASEVPSISISISGKKIE
jgi:hypothetical protein